MVPKDKDWAIAYYNATLSDIEFTKRRQFVVAYYTALGAAGIYATVYTFTQQGIDKAWIFDAALIAAFVHGISSFMLQFGLISSLSKFRGRLKEIYKSMDPNYKHAEIKFLRDLFLFLYLMLIPIAATIVVILYVYEVRS